MRGGLTILIPMLLAATALSAQPPAYQAGKLVEMDSVQCARFDKTAKTSMCAEYSLQTEELTYTIRPLAARHSSLLPVGDWVRFRIEEEELVLRVDGETDNKEREFHVISIKPRGESNAEVRSIRLNHLQ